MYLWEKTNKNKQQKQAKARDGHTSVRKVETKIVRDTRHDVKQQNRHETRSEIYKIDTNLHSPQALTDKNKKQVSGGVVDGSNLKQRPASSLRNNR
jgi:hypothetical protein